MNPHKLHYPEDWKNAVGGVLHQDFDRVYDSIEDGINEIVDAATSGNKSEVLSFASKILNSDLNDGALEKIFKKSGSYIFFSDRTIYREILERVKNTLEGEVS